MKKRKIICLFLGILLVLVGIIVGHIEFSKKVERELSPTQLIPFKQEIWNDQTFPYQPHEDEIINFSNKNDIILCSKHELLVYSCNLFYFIFFKRNGNTHNQRMLFYYKYHYNINEFITRPVFISDYSELKQYLIKHNLIDILGTYKDKNIEQ